MSELTKMRLAIVRRATQQALTDAEWACRTARALRDDADPGSKAKTEFRHVADDLEAAVHSLRLAHGVVGPI